MLSSTIKLITYNLSWGNYTIRIQRNYLNYCTYFDSYTFKYYVLPHCLVNKQLLMLCHIHYTFNIFMRFFFSNDISILIYKLCLWRWVRHNIICFYKMLLSCHFQTLKLWNCTSFGIWNCLVNITGLSSIV